MPKSPICQHISRKYFAFIIQYKPFSWILKNIHSLFLFYFYLWVCGMKLRLFCIHTPPRNLRSRCDIQNLLFQYLYLRIMIYYCLLSCTTLHNLYSFIWKKSIKNKTKKSKNKCIAARQDGRRDGHPKCEAYRARQQFAPKAFFAS